VLGLLESHRFVTISGTGGIGKTRLGLQVARRLEKRYPDGVWWVEFAPVSDPDLVPETVVRALGIHLESREKALSSLQFFLEERQLLLVIDNCEHLVEACSQMANALLRSCPNLSILTTSRETIGIGGETIFQLQPMIIPGEDIIPTQDNIEDYEALHLFIERAQDICPGFQATEGNVPAINHICRRVDGIPLAIELTVARTRMMGIEEIALRLEDRFRLLTGGNREALPRHQTLRGCIDWSYELLTEEERILLQRLSVFAGRWTLEGAEYVGCGDGIETYQVLDLLGQLVNKSLITTVQEENIGTCYRMLDTIRQYAHEKLVESGSLQSSRDRHLKYYVDLVERLEKVIRGPQLPVVINRLETELDNIRLALRWSLKDEGNVCWKTRLGLRLGSALLWFWHIRGRDEEGLRSLELLIECERELRIESNIQEKDHAPVKSLVLAKALMVAGWHTVRTGDYIKGRERLLESRDLYSKMGAEGKLGYALTLYFLGVVAFFQGDLSQVEKISFESLAISRELGDRFGQAECFDLIGNSAWANREYIRARTYLEDALALYREIGDQDATAFTLMEIGLLMIDRNRSYDSDLEKQGRALLEESQQLFAKTNNVSSLVPIRSLGELEWKHGNYTRAAECFYQVLAHGEKYSSCDNIVLCLSSLGRLALSQGNEELASKMFDRSLVSSLKRNRQNLIAWSLLNFGILAWESGNYNQAAKKYMRALEICQEIGFKLGEATSYYGLGRVSLARGKIGPARVSFTEALEIGQKTTQVSLIVEAFAMLAVSQHALERSARLLGTTDAWHTSWHRTRTPKERQEREDVLKKVRQGLGEEAFAAAWEKGVAMTLEEAIEYCLGGGGE
jgi:predicted ATPase/Tfp pilus assembly protein PilF